LQAGEDPLACVVEGDGELGGGLVGGAATEGVQGALQSVVWFVLVERLRCEGECEMEKDGARSEVSGIRKSRA